MRLLLSSSLFIILSIVALPLSTTQATTNDPLCFAETGQCIHGPIRAYWEMHGGTLVFGLPISPQQEVIDSQPMQVQWFQRARFELRGDTVQLGRVGVDLLWSYGIDWWTLPKGQPQDGCLFFAETQHTLCEPFLSHWLSHGAHMEIFGQPISEPRWELRGGEQASVRQAQWFERVRFEVVNGVVVATEVGTELLGQQAPAAPAPQTNPALESTSLSFTTAATGDDDEFIPITYPGHISEYDELRTGAQDLFNCDDFDTWEEAWRFYQANFPGDPNRLDEDKDGIPCEDLPNAP